MKQKKKLYKEKNLSLIMKKLLAYGTSKLVTVEHNLHMVLMVLLKSEINLSLDIHDNKRFLH